MGGLSTKWTDLSAVKQANQEAIQSKNPALAAKEWQASMRQVDAHLYNQYQSDVLKSRQTFALDKGFLDAVIDLHQDKRRWLDAGAGQCGTIAHLVSRGIIEAYGTELSNPTTTECRTYVEDGMVKQAPLHRIPFPTSHFDLVWSSEVLEHVPTEMVNGSVAELVRVAKSFEHAALAHDPMVSFVSVNRDRAGK
ncbi:hypothetical protein CYMTET_2560 [Cymbomonas tetramitiformis]|uniref:Methyltransferase type 11 domain-containing protein n=1 Tax=Cymbomonas tetramitiformis TaxID=36881 RepID=A0AAE0C6U9_9CHLO|nr:hypothetical protein CYMTET_41086 [Cymbomonas tetramitiformis]KAK3290019.1 hypothetical protein CYMTET_2560 [Cymbomonas tetramitiformis]